MQKRKNKVQALFENAGVETVSIDNEVYRENGLTPVDIRQSPAMRRTLEAGYRKTLGSMKNLTLTTANTSQTAYINACNQAYMQITSGAFSYQEAIRQAIQRTAQNGAMVTYPSGHTERIDVAVRRAVLTGVGQTCREIGMMNAEECGCDLMEISAHSGARPDHAKWQGKIVSLSGRRGYLSLKDIGYGTGDGFGGWNCRHDWFPFFEGVSKPVYNAQDLQKLDEKNIMYNGKMYSQYEISQIQRRYEREIRAAKREQSAFSVAVEEADDPELKQVMQDSLNYSNSLVKDRQAKMRDFIRQTGQDRDYFREQNYSKENNDINHIKYSVAQNSSNGYIDISENNGIITLEEISIFENNMKKLGFENVTGFENFQGNPSVLNELYNDFSKLKSAFPNHFNGISINFGNQEIGENAYAGYNTVTGVFHFNPSIYNSLSNLEQFYKSDVLANYHPKGTTYRATVFHEFGHYIEKIANINNKKLVKLLYNKFNNGYFNRKLGDEWIGKNLSYYAAEGDYGELVSEAFAEYFESSEPRFLCIEIVNEVMKNLS